MPNREIGRTLIEVGRWIAARTHHVVDQAIRHEHRTPWIVDEERLHRAPALEEGPSFGLAQVVYGVPTDAFHAPLQHRLRAAAVAPLAAQSAFVLRPVAA